MQKRGSERKIYVLKNLSFKYQNDLKSSPLYRQNKENRMLFVFQRNSFKTNGQ